MASSSSTSTPVLAIAAALALALSAARNRVAIETAVIDTALLGAVTALVWVSGRARYGARGAGAGALALVLFAPMLGGVGGGGLGAAFLLAVGLTVLTRCLLDPTIQLVAVAGLCLGLAVAILEVDGAPRATVVAALSAGGLALIAWRAMTAERCEPRARVVQGAVVSVVLAALAGAAMLALVDSLPPLEPTEYTRVWPAAVTVADPAPRSGGLLLLFNALPLLALAAAWRPRRTSRYADGATVIGLAVGVAIGAAAPVLLALLAAPWLALLTGGAVARAERPGLMRFAAAALIVQALTAALLWPDYPRLSDGWTPLPAAADTVPT